MHNFCNFSQKLTQNGHRSKGKTLEDNVRKNLDGDAFLSTTPKTQSMKEVIDNLYFIKNKSFCSVRDNIRRMRGQATDWEKIFAKDTSDKGLVSQNIQRTLKTQQ